MKNESSENSWQYFSSRWLPAVENHLKSIMAEVRADPGCPVDLAQAMEYALLGGGKRLRPLMTLAAGYTVGVRENDLECFLDGACAVELVHCYSMVHDDLPEMDNDDYRRGRPSCHKAFGPGLALLAGDALLTHAFFLLSRLRPAELAARAVTILSRAAGPWGMVGGQADDIRSWEKPSLEIVESLQARKTAALFAAALELGGTMGGAGPEQLEALVLFGRFFGMAFQIADDLLSWRGESDKLGRPTDSDRVKGRPIHPLVAGEEASSKRVEQLLAAAQNELKIWDFRAEVLGGLVNFLRERIFRK